MLPNEQESVLDERSEGENLHSFEGNDVKTTAGQKPAEGYEVQIKIDEEALNLGFKQPFVLLLSGSGNLDKGVLFRKIVDMSNDIKSTGNEILNNEFKRFVQRTFNMSEGAFNDKESLLEECERVSTSISALSEVGSVSVENSEVEDFEWD